MSIRYLPVCRRAFGTLKHLLGLLTLIVDPACVIGPPSGIVVIARRHGLDFSLLIENEQFIPTPREVEETLEGTANSLQPLIWPSEVEGRGRGQHGPGGL